MNRRKKEADQHKGWNISISGVFIAMVMGIVLTSVVAATLIFVQIYRNAMEQSAVTSSSQSCEQVQNTVENYTQDMRIILEGIVARMRHENNHSEEYIQNLVNIRSDVVAVTICGEDGELLRYWNRGQKLKENYRIVQSTEMEDDDGRLRITKPYVESLFQTRDQALSLWNGSTGSKTREYQRTNPREYQIVRTHTKETTGIQDPASPNHQ